MREKKSVIPYDYKIEKSIEWLVSCQNKKDNGWGMWEKCDSRIVNTAEAVIALSAYGFNLRDPTFRGGIEYLLNSLKNKSWCKYTRHFAWISFALIYSGQKEILPKYCIKKIVESNQNGGFFDVKGEYPDIYTTFLSMRALYSFPEYEEIIYDGCNWIYSQKNKNLWNSRDGKLSFSATTNALNSFALSDKWLNNYQENLIESINQLQLAIKNGACCEHEQNVADDHKYSFHHYLLPFSLMAFLNYRIDPFNPLIIQLVKELTFDHYCNPYGGWSEEKNYRPTVYATAHTMYALEYFYRFITIDPIISNVINPVEEDKKVFIVHGHDNETKDELSKFLNRINCAHHLLIEEKEDGLETIFQKLNRFADMSSFAIVLMTPDDKVLDKSGIKERVRQNVILELGLFMGKLGLNNVCLIKKGDIEFPSDIYGVLYIDMEKDDWMLRLEQKLKSAEIRFEI